jgi:putative acetyltransferase
MSAPEVVIRGATGDYDMDRIRELLREYAGQLNVDLCFQDFENELATLPGRYGQPRGSLLIAMSGDKAAGCIAFRPVDQATCEMKRLFVRRAFRGTGLGRRLVMAIIGEARSRGYKKMRLDTLPQQVEAHRLYESLGFRDIPPYSDFPIAGSRFLSLDL